MEVDIFIHPDGTIRFLYYDSVKNLLDLGQSEIKRASHVEPEKTEFGWRWYADLSPVAGPKLGPFDGRDDAIAAEVEWLVENHLGKSNEQK
jgi:hypothetical protein